MTNEDGESNCLDEVVALVNCRRREVHWALQKLADDSGIAVVDCDCEDACRKYPDEKP